MARSLDKDPSISQRNNASCIGNQRKMARRAKTQNNKTDRQRLKKDMENRMRKGIALVEVLLIFCIIAILVAMLIPAVMQAREAWQKQENPSTPVRYVLSDPIRPTHWDQEQWDTLDRYLKKIDDLEERLSKLEQR